MSNNSGHYKPGYDNLKTFVRFLLDLQVVNNATEVTCLGRNDFEGRLGAFLQSATI